LQQFELIDQTRSEAGSALDCWSDIVVTGSVGEDRFRGGFEPFYDGGNAMAKEALLAVSKQVNTFLLPSDHKLMLVRDMAKYGSQFEQIGIDFQDGKPYPARLVNMPIKTMKAVRQKDGTMHPAQAYAQGLRDH